tara:strand:+ start:5131 stop:6183 length:1053 start_codon:yes stop_codon:yes gene_type:complete
MSVQNASDLKSSIQTDLADNNAGQISAFDIRHNMEDLVDSIVPIVASGDFQTFPFNNLPLFFNSLIVAKSGVKFDTDETSSFSESEKIQNIPFRGVGNIPHSGLAGLDQDHHDQYVPRSGVRNFTGNVPVGNIENALDTTTVSNNGGWINNSGNKALADLSLCTNNHGLGFAMTNPDTGKYGEIIHVGSGNFGGANESYTQFKFDYDKSSFHTAKSTALAWISFNGAAYLNGSLSDSGLSGITVNSAYNISAIHASGAGTYKIFFKSGLIADGSTDYTVVAHSNGTTSNSGPQSMDLVTPAVVVREDDFFTLAVRNDNGEFVNSRVNDIVVYGHQSGVVPEASVTVQNFT